MATKKLEECQQNAEEVKVLIQDNAVKLFEREGKLENLELRSEELKNKAMNFQKTAQTVERKTRWEKWRWYIIAGGIVVIVIIIVIIIIASQFGGGEVTSTPAVEDGN